MLPSLKQDGLGLTSIAKKYLQCLLWIVWLHTSAFSSTQIVYIKNYYLDPNLKQNTRHSSHSVVTFFIQLILVGEKIVGQLNVIAWLTNCAKRV